MYNFIEFFFDIIQLGLLFTTANMLAGKSLKEINLKVLIGFILINDIYWAFFDMNGTPLMMANTYLIKNILFIVAISQVCKTGILLSSSLGIIVGLLPAPLMALPEIIANQFPYIRSDKDLYTMVYGIFVDIGLILVIIIFKKLLTMNIQKKIIRLIYMTRYILTAFLLFTTFTTMKSFLNASNFRDITLYDFALTLWTSILLVTILLFITIKGRKAKKTIAMQYRKINEQQERIYKYYEDGSHLKHDYNNILLTLKSAVDSEHLDDISRQLEEIEKYAVGV